MPVSTAAVGKEYPATTYEVGLEKIREYANAVGQTEPVRGAGVEQVAEPVGEDVVPQRRWRSDGAGQVLPQPVEHEGQPALRLQGLRARGQ